MNALASILATVLATCEVEQRPRRESAGMVCRSPYRDGSWRAQRILHRSQARFRLLVSGRGVGKSHGCAYELLQLVMAAPPNSMGAVLAPTLTHAEAAVEKLRELAADLPGVTDKSWISTKRVLKLPGGRWIKIFSADRKEVVRGPSIVALWVDEGAFLKSVSIDSSMPALRRPGVVVRMLVSTTPAGKNWVKEWWDRGNTSRQEVFRFKGTESPYNDPEIVAHCRETMSPEKFAQEYLAAFVDNLLLAFPDRDKLFVDQHPPRKKARRWLGVDLGQSDYCVCTELNDFGEGEVVDRWNEETPGYRPATYSSQTVDRVIQLLLERQAALVIDTGSAGPSLGTVIAEAAREKGIEVIEVKTSSQGTKARIVEQTRADVQWEKLRIKRNKHSAQLDYELSKFQAIKRVHHGQELMIYEGPQIAGEYDDCVISLCLANWGRARAGEEHDPLGGPLDSFVDDVASLNRSEPGESHVSPASDPADDEYGGWGAVDGTGFSF